MIITDRFVLLNFPRTGSTFVRQALRTLYGQAHGGRWRALQGRLGWGRPRFRELRLPIDRTATARREGRRSQHGAYSQIPPRHRGKPCVSVTRHPLDRLVSLYEHGFWRDHPPAEPTAIRKRFPEFPELDFGRFLELLDTFDLPNVLQGRRLRADVGPQTVHFVRFYAVDPEAALERLTDEAIDSGTFARELGPVRFLHLERLSRELGALLQELGFDADELAFLEQLDPVNAAPSRAGRPWHEYLDDAQRSRLLHRERLLFRCFPEYDA